MKIFIHVHKINVHLFIYYFAVSIISGISYMVCFFLFAWSYGCFINQRNINKYVIDVYLYFTIQLQLTWKVDLLFGFFFYFEQFKAFVLHSKQLVAKWEVLEIFWLIKFFTLETKYLWMNKCFIFLESKSAYIGF